jgi:hypothetical protein
MPHPPRLSAPHLSRMRRISCYKICWRRLEYNNSHGQAGEEDDGNEKSSAESWTIAPTCRRTRARSDLQAAVIAMRSGANYVPGARDPYNEWWQSITGGLGS